MSIEEIVTVKENSVLIPIDKETYKLLEQGAKKAGMSVDDFATILVKDLNYTMKTDLQLVFKTLNAYNERQKKKREV